METAEARAISALSKNKDMHLALGVDREVFGAYADVFDFMRDYYVRHRDVPSKQTLSERFSKVDFVETDAPTAYYLSALKNEYVGANLRSLLALADSRLDMGDAAPGVLQVLNQRLAKLGKHTTSSRDVDLMDVDHAIEHYRRLKELSGVDGVPGIKTGFKSIDSVYSTGFAPGQSIVVMGYTGRMKSFWTALLAVNAIRQGKKVLVISLEMSPEEYGDRVFALLGNGKWSLDDLQRGDIDEDEFREWAKRDFKSKFIVPSFEGVHEVTPDLIRSKIEQYQPDLVICDYMQLMMDNAHTAAMTPRMMNLSRELKLMAVSCAIPVVSITAVTDDESRKQTGPPTLSMVAWSRAIEYDANLIVAVHRHDDANIVEVVARKSRHSDLFDFGFEVDANRGVWTERFDLF
jgi:replicative DNA helicase